MKLIVCMQLNIKVSSKLILCFLLTVARNVQNTENNKFILSVEYLKKEVRDEVIF